MRVVAFAVLCVLIGCEGPMGPAGPQGEPGPQGPVGIAGPRTTRIILEGTMPAGTFLYDLEADAGTITNPPVTLSCMVKQPGSSLWHIITATGRCGFEPRTSNPNGPLRLYLRGTEPGWAYSLIVGY